MLLAEGMRCECVECMEAGMRPTLRSRWDMACGEEDNMGKHNYALPERWKISFVLLVFSWPLSALADVVKWVGDVHGAGQLRRLREIVVNVCGACSHTHTCTCAHAHTTLILQYTHAHVY